MLISAAKYKTSFATLLWKKDPRIYLEKKTENKKAVSILPPGWQQQKAL